MQSLDDRARALLTNLDGHWSGSGGMCRCPAHDDRTPSLSIKVGKKALLFKCFAGCSRSEVMAAIRSRRLEIGAHGSDSQTRNIRTADDRFQRAAQGLWSKAGPIAGTPSDDYLANRGLSSISPELRYLARTPLGPSANVRHHPAIIAAVRADEGVIAVQRIFLNGDTGGPAAFSPHRRSLGPLGIGAVRLAWPDDGELGLAEGVEDAVAVTQLTGMACWALLGNLRFGTAAIPDSVTDLHLFVDNDAGGDTAWELGSAHFARGGRTIVKRQPRMPGYDWDDVHRKWRERQPA